MAIDLSKDDDSGLIPDGIYKVRLKVVPGGYGDDGVLKLSKRGTLAMINTVNAVVDGPYAGTEIWHTICVETVPADCSDEKDQKTARWGRTRVKQIVASARAVDTETSSAAELSKLLTIESWGEVDDLVFWAEIGSKPAENGYQASNTIERAVTPADRDWPGSPAQPKLPTRAISKPKRDDFDDSVPF